MFLYSYKMFAIEDGGVASEVGGAEADLPLPSTPKIPEVSLIRQQVNVQCTCSMCWSIGN